MKTKDTYIKISAEDEPTPDELKLDNYVDVEYDTPYIETDNFDDLLNVGGVIETGSIFDGR